MDRFFSEENIRRYRKLRDAVMGAQRATILKQLAEEETAFKVQFRARSEPAAPIAAEHR
jgi:hypothetical protein